MGVIQYNGREQQVEKYVSYQFNDIVLVQPNRT